MNVILLLFLFSPLVTDAAFRTQYSYKINTKKLTNNSNHIYHKIVIDRAFTFWESYSLFRFDYDENSNDIIVYLIRGDESKYIKNILGFVAHNNPLHIFICMLNFCSEDSKKFYNVLVHEIGHTLGLSNNLDPQSVMYEHENNILDFDSPLPAQDKLELDRLIDRGIQNYFLEAVDTLIKIEPHTWLAFKENKYYRVLQQSQIKEGSLIQLLPFRIQQVDAFSFLDNGTMAIFSKSEYWTFDNLTLGSNFDCQNVKSRFNIDTSTERIIGMIDIGYDRLLFLTNKTSYLFWNDILMEYLLRNGTKDIIGVYPVDKEFISIIKSTGKEYIYWKHNLTFIGEKNISQLSNLSKYFFDIYHTENQFVQLYKYFYRKFKEWFPICY